jgi:hypothetical protein
MSPFAILLALVQPAAAIDLQSLRSEATFGLFRDPYDYITQPGLLARQDGNLLYTLLSGQTDAGRMGLGYQGVLGNVSLGALADYRHAGTTESSTNESTFAKTSSKSESEGWTRASELSFVLGAGMPLSKKFSLGAALRIDNASFGQTEDISGGGYAADTRTYVDGEMSTSTTGTREQSSGNIMAIVGAALGGDKKWVSIDAFVTRPKSITEINTKAEDLNSEYTYTLKGFDAGSPLETNFTAFGPGIRLDSQYAVNKVLDLRLAASYMMSSGAANLDKVEGTVTDTSSGDSVTETYAIKDTSVKGSLANVLFAMHYGDDDLRLRAGISATFSSMSSAWTSETSTTASKADPTVWKDSYGGGVREIGLPIAVELPVHERWILRSGARFSSYKVSGEGTFEQKPTEDSTIKNERTASSSGTGVVATLGFRFKATEKFRLDAAILGSNACDASGCSGSSGVFDNTTVYGSGVVRW